MNKLSIFVFTLLFAYSSINAQEKVMKTFHSFGGGTIYLFEEGIGLPNFTYSLRRTVFQISDEKNVSLNTELDLGIGATEMMGIAWKIPISADINFGHGSSTKSEKKIGAYLGAGYGHSVLIYEYDELYIIETNGLFLHTGVRFSTARAGSFGLDLNGILGKSETLIGVKAFKTFGLTKKVKKTRKF